MLLFWLTDIRAIEVIDDEGRRVFLEQPAQRIISLSPHITELLFSAGAGDKISGVDEYSDYPEQVQSIKRIGDATHLDVETILALEADLIVAWGNGLSHEKFVEQLINLQQTVYISSPEHLHDIPLTVENLGRLAGTFDLAHHRAEAFRNELQGIINEYSHRPVVTVFYEIWHQPMFTINGQHVMSKVIEMCGGRNVFAELPIISPNINQEAVIAANPDVIIASGIKITSTTNQNASQRPPWLDEWRQWPTLKAVKKNQLYHINPDLLQRHTFRILQGSKILCDYLQSAR